MKQILTNLYQHQKLSRTAARDILLQIGRETYGEAEIASFITVYLMRAITSEELQGFQEALLELCIPIDLEGRPTIDIVGTGGDGKNTFNISTLAAFVTAGAGYQVAKHGNYGVSSNCGSSNVLQHLGYKFTPNRDTLLRQLDRAGICFLHAPLFHPAMKAVAPVRRTLGVKTFFNMLGPLVNPAQPQHQLLGVYNLELARLYQYILQQSNKRFAIVHALDGYDEVSLTGAFKLRTEASDQLLEPGDLNLPQYEPGALYGGDTVPEAAEIFLAVLENRSTQAQQDVVVANAGLAIQCLQAEKPLADCLEEARDSIRSGKAREALTRVLA